MNFSTDESIIYQQRLLLFINYGKHESIGFKKWDRGLLSCFFTLVYFRNKRKTYLRLHPVLVETLETSYVSLLIILFNCEGLSVILEH